MKKYIAGSWIIHHCRKIQETTSQEYEAIGLAGKCGILLSAITASEQRDISTKRLNALARANGINVRTELPTILSRLENGKLIARGEAGIATLGLSGHTVLSHTADIFIESEPEDYEKATIVLAEKVSDKPLVQSEAKVFISDTYKIPSRDVDNLVQVGANIGFYDLEEVSANDSLIFNGNLFRDANVKKIKAVLDSLASTEERLVVEINDRLKTDGCLTVEDSQRMLGPDLFSKLQSIGMIEVNTVGNENGRHQFVTRPAAFCKFSKADDALDLAKAMVAALTYGRLKSSHGRGRIQDIAALMNKLIDGRSIGPATAIGQDYQALELRGVVEVSPTSGGMYTMKLLKPDVGKLALSVLQSGDAMASGNPDLLPVDISDYVNPEINRTITRKNSTPKVRREARNLLQDLRTGGLN